MFDSFNKFKNKIVLETIIKSIIFGISFGLIAFSVPFIFIKVYGREFKVLYLILIAVSIAILLSGLMFLILKPSKRKVAIRLDKQLNLNEKVQTMVEYENKEGIMISIQRKTTLDILSNISIKKLTMKFSVIFLILLFIALAFSVTAIVVPAYDETNPGDLTEQPPYEDPYYDIDDWTVKAILDIIEVVNKSTITESLKTKYVDELYGLIDKLQITEKESEMKALVTSTIDTVKLELDIINTNNEIYSVLKESDNSAVLTLATQINLLKVENIANALDGIVILISGNSEAIVELNYGFGIILKSSYLDKDDQLYTLLVKLADDINGCANASDVNTAVKEAINLAKDDIVAVIEQQAENKNIADYIEDKLIEIFNLEIVDENNDGNSNNEGDNSNNEEDQNDPDENEGNSSGGYGTGDLVVGSDDIFFDPKEGVIKYSEVIHEYYGNINGMFSDGVIPEELREYFTNYFNYLYGNFNEEE